MNGFMLIPAPNMRRFWEDPCGSSILDGFATYRMRLIDPDGTTTPVKGWVDAYRFIPKVAP